MLFDEEFNHIGVLKPDGRMDIDENKLARWVAGEVEPTKKCEPCAQWSLCHNRYCPATTFSPRGCKNENCGYERRAIYYILKLLNKADSKFIKTYR